MAAAGKLDLDGNTATISGISGAGGTVGNSSTSANGTLVYSGSGSSTFAGSINDTLGAGNKKTALTVANDTLTLTGSNGYTGNTTINSSATLQVGNGGASGSLAATNIVDNGMLVSNVTTNPTISGAISGIGGLTQSGTGTLTLLGNNSYGQTFINAGTMQAGSGGSSGSPGEGNITVNGNTMIFNRGDTVTFVNNINGTAGGVVKNTGGGTVTLSGLISGAVALQQNGAGTLIMPNINTYTGVTTVNNGFLQVSGSGGSSALGTGNVIVNSPGTLVGATGDAFGYYGTDASPGLITVNGGTITDLGTANYRLTIPNLTFTGGTLTSVLTNTGDANGLYTFQGPQIRSPASTGPFTLTTNSASTTVVINPSGNISLNADADFVVAAGTVTGGATPGVDLLISSSLVAYQNNPHSITKDGSGVLELTGSNTYGGSAGPYSATLNLGTVAITRDVAISGGNANPVINFNGGTLQFVNYASSTLPASVFNNIANLKLGAATGAASSLSTAIGGTSVLTYNGPGTLNLTSSNSYSGGTTVAAGILGVNNVSALGTGPLAINSGATAKLNTGTGAGPVVLPSVVDCRQCFAHRHARYHQ